MGATFEEILQRDGRLVYTSVGDSMRPSTAGIRASMCCTAS